MKRQDAVSSSRREGSPENLHTKSIGCMSGIFQLVYGSNQSRRFLTFGKRQENNAVSSPKKSVNNSVANIEAEISKEENKISTIQRFSCDVPRSPTLPAEIRRSNSVNSPENFRAPPALVARLMGLEEGPVMTPESTVEKRRKLLRALERCDEDLNALKKIIEVVKNNVSAAGGGDSGDEKIKRCSSSPVVVSHHRHVVLDEFARCAVSGGDAKRHANARVMTQQQQQRQQRKIIKPVEEGIGNNIFTEKLMPTEWIEAKTSNIHSSNIDEDYYEMWNDKVMIETVNEICRDIDWGEKREIGRIGLALHDRIWRDLVDEIVRDMKCFVEVHSCSLPLEACRKRLRF
ncbi:hypothetical protein HS088_TW05G00637 [Tripterygium wilfordii]|uniref:DUF3741 domain-containing protein n=1 Tax=Tripterygium wilfordii TaxID=458696 RepID=A0A7J7DNL8_TRIWF|nr:uncharacterized protein LOC119998899 [Tripterygium wilfordii]KAF5747907.1 hypothetical protein HS088_TW05G00637 [Tripterygium wilfordii]